MSKESMVRSRRRIRTLVLISLISSSFTIATVATTDAFAGVIQNVETTRIDLTFQALSFNRALRTDRGPSAGTAKLPTYVPPDRTQREIVSPAVPSSVAPDRLRLMKLADTYWVAPGKIALSWEVVFGNPRVNGLVPTLGLLQGVDFNTFQPASEMTVGLDGITEPERRRWLYFLNTPLSTGAGGYFDTAYFLGGALEVGIKRCHEHRYGAGPYDWPRRLDGDCEMDLAKQLCRSHDTAVGLMPWSVLGCQVMISEDTGFSFHVTDAQGNNVRSKIPGIDHFPMETMTQFRVVDGPRMLSRPLQFDNEECTRFYEGDRGDEPCTDEDWAAIDALRECADVELPRTIEGLKAYDAACGGSQLQNTRVFGQYGAPTSTRLRSTWQFQVSENPSTHELTETFSDDLRIREIRIFVERDGVREYLLEDELQRISINGQDCEIASGSGEAVFDLRGCDEFENNGTVTRRNIVANPTWAESDVQTVVRWEVTLRAYNKGTMFANDLAVRANERLFIEFQVAPR